MEKGKNEIKKFLSPISLILIFIATIAIIVYILFPSIRNILLTVAVTVIVTLLSAILFDAYRKPYPINRLDHLMKVTFKSSAIRGENLVYFRRVTTNCESRKEMFNFLKRDSRNGDFSELKNELSKIFEITDLVLKENKVTLKIMADLHQKYKEKQNVRGKFEVQIIEEGTDDQMELEKEVSVEFTVTFNEWDYKNVKDHLHDASIIVDSIISLIGQEYRYEKAPPVVKFQTNIKPVVLAYINEINRDGQELNNTLSITAGKNLFINFSDKNCEVIGAYGSSDFDKIVNAMSWYV